MEYLNPGNIAFTCDWCGAPIMIAGEEGVMKMEGKFDAESDQNIVNGERRMRLHCSECSHPSIFAHSAGSNGGMVVKRPELHIQREGHSHASSGRSQMNLPDLCKRISRAMCQVMVGDGDNVSSAGSGVFVEGGLLLTAAHVLFHPNGKLRGKNMAVRGEGYMTGLPGTWSGPLMMHFNPKVLRPVPIDLVVIRPEVIPEPVNPLPFSDGFAPVGTEVLVGGFPDDVDRPLSIQDYLETMNPDMTQLRREMDEGVWRHFRPSMFKRCMVGSVQGVTLKSESQRSVTIVGAEYWLDNHLTYGGSGGPMVSMSGSLLGTVVRKGFTNEQRLGIRSIDESGVKSVKRLPSGIGLALSHQFVTEGMEAGIVRPQQPEDGD